MKKASVVLLMVSCFSFAAFGQNESSSIMEVYESKIGNFSDYLIYGIDSCFIIMEHGKGTPKLYQYCLGGIFEEARNLKKKDSRKVNTIIRELDRIGNTSDQLSNRTQTSNIITVCLVTDGKIINEVYYPIIWQYGLGAKKKSFPLSKRSHTFLFIEFLSVYSR